MKSADLASLLAPTNVQKFLESFWTRAPFLSRAQERHRFSGLLDLAEFEFLLSAVATPGWLSFVAGVVRPPTREQLTRDGTLDVAAIQKAIADKQSLLLTKVHRLHPSIGALCRQITADFRSAGVVLRKPIRANAYFTPPNSQGFAPHYDDHDVLVLQLHGEKTWRIFGEAVKWPRKPMLDSLGTNVLDSKARELTLLAGDVLYVPRGFVHEAEARDTSSLHLTLSVQAATWSDVFERLIDLEDRLGEPLPLGFCSGGLPQASDKASVAKISGTMIQWPGLSQAITDVFNSTFTEGDLPPNGYLTRAESDIELKPEAWLAAADGISASLELDGEAAVLRLAGATLRAGTEAGPLFRKLCDAEPFKFSELEIAASASLVDLAQELLRRGILVVRSEVS